MFLFEAITLGRMLRPQCQFWFRSEDGSSCANGAAMEAAGMFERVPIGKIGDLMTFAGAATQYGEGCVYAKRFPIVAHVMPDYGDNVGMVIATMNNNGKTDADICRWLEPIERAYYAEHPEAMPPELCQSLAEAETEKELVTA